MDEKGHERKLEELAERLLEEDAFYAARATGLISADALRKKHKEEIIRLLVEGDLKRSLERGFRLIADRIASILSNEDFDEFVAEFSKINHENLEHPPEGREGATFQEHFGLSNTFLLRIYTLACEVYQAGEFDNALDLFTTLAVLNPFVFDFWNGKALCYQAKKQWEKALETFSIAIKADQKRVRPHIARAECWIALREPEHAREELIAVEELLAAHPEKREYWSGTVAALRKDLQW